MERPIPREPHTVTNALSRPNATWNTNSVPYTAVMPSPKQNLPGREMASRARQPALFGGPDSELAAAV
jgi:hypothetical protein